MLDLNLVKINEVDSVSGYVVPKEFIVNCTLSQLEGILGFQAGRLEEGAVFLELQRIPTPQDFEYRGDTRTADHHWDSKRKEVEQRGAVVSQGGLNQASHAYLKSANSKLIKVIAIKGYDKGLSNDENFPPGLGGMQFKIERSKPVPATVVAVVRDYPNGVFRG